MGKVSLILAAIALSIVALLFFTVLTQKGGDVQAPTPTTQPTSTLCTDTHTGVTMSYLVAVEIAQGSDCVVEGPLLETYSCNENTGTWWIDLDIDKPDCAPACVVDVNTQTAKINWRCTGLIP